MTFKISKRWQRALSPFTFQRCLFALLLLIILLEFLFFFIYRRVNLDEGWYLKAATLVYQGQMLYADFAYTQTPLLPYIYGFFLQAVGIGLYQGRVLTIVFAIGTWLLSAATARRLSGSWASVICLAFLAISFFAITQYTYTATYALTACLIAAAIYISLLKWPTDLRHVLATMLICLAVCTRLSTIVILPPFLLYLLLTSEKKWRAFWIIGLTTIVTLGGILGSFWLRNSELMVYDIWGFHLDRILRTSWQLRKIRDRMLRTIVDFWLPISLTLWAGVWFLRRLIVDPFSLIQRRQCAAVGTMILMIVGLFVAHLIPRTTDSYYNALQLPMMSVVGSVILNRWLAQARARDRKGDNHHQWLWSGFVLLALTIYGGLQLRATLRDGALIPPLYNHIAVVQKAAAAVQQYVPVDEPILTFNQHLALEAQRPTLPGYEMSIFAYRPTWERERALHHKVINNELLLDHLAQPAAAAAFTKFDFGQIYGERDAFFATLNAEYRWFYTFDNFGPYGDALYLYVPPQFEPQQPQYHYPSTFADNIFLLGYDLAQANINKNATLDVALYWQAGRSMSPTQEYTVFVQLLNDDGQFVTGFDNPPCRRTCPTTSWQPGEFLRDEYRLALDRIVSGDYQLQIGLYDAAGIRLKVLAGPFAEEDRILLTTVVVGKR